VFVPRPLACGSTTCMSKPPEVIVCHVCRWGKLVKPEKITKFNQQDGNSTCFKKFCDSDDRCVFVYEVDGELTANGRPPHPSKMGKKVLAFSKNEEDAGVTLEV